MTIPAVSSATIGDLIPSVQLILQNRQDISSYQPEVFMMKAIQEISLKLPFEELRVTGPNRTLIPQTYSYPVSFWTNPGDDYTTPYSISIFTNYPQNTVAFPLKYDTPAGIRPLTFIPGGLPAQWCRYGTNIWLGPQPGLPYTAFMDYQIRHPFNMENLLATVVRLPLEWLEVVEYATAYRMANGPLRWSDMANQYRALLYGDPNDTSQPGLIKSLVVQATLDQSIHSRKITLMTQRTQ